MHIYISYLQHFVAVFLVSSLFVYFHENCCNLSGVSSYTQDKINRFWLEGWFLFDCSKKLLADDLLFHLGWWVRNFPGFPVMVFVSYLNSYVLLWSLGCTRICWGAFSTMHSTCSVHMVKSMLATRRDNLMIDGILNF